MIWEDEGILLKKRVFAENSLVVEFFTKNHGKVSAIIYGGTSRKIKNYLQIGNKLKLIYKSKNLEKMGYFNTEIIDVNSAIYFDNKKILLCIQSVCSLLCALLPENEKNTSIYESCENLFINLKNKKWILNYILWERLLIKELGFEFDHNANINEQSSLTLSQEFDSDNMKISNRIVFKALKYNKNLLLNNFFLPNKITFSFERNCLENYYNT